MFNQPQEIRQPSTVPVAPTPIPPGPVPASGPRHAGDIPDPPLDSAGEPRKRTRKAVLNIEDKALLRSILHQFNAAQSDRTTVVTSYLCSNCRTWHKDQTCRYGLCRDCSGRIVELLDKLE